MRFLLRAAFWLGIVVMLLPAGPSHNTKTPQLSTTDAVAAAVPDAGARALIAADPRAHEYVRDRIAIADG